MMEQRKKGWDKGRRNGTKGGSGMGQRKEDVEKRVTEVRNVIDMCVQRALLIIQI